MSIQFDPSPVSMLYRLWQIMQIVLIPNQVALSLGTYCQFSVSRHLKQIIIKIKTAPWIKPRIWEKREGKYTKTLAKIQVTTIFLKQNMWRNILPKFIEICMEMQPWWPEKKSETSDHEICCKSVNLILFLIYEQFRQPKCPTKLTL